MWAKITHFSNTISRFFRKIKDNRQVIFSFWYSGDFKKVSSGLQQSQYTFKLACRYCLYCMNWRSSRSSQQTHSIQIQVGYGKAFQLSLSAKDWNRLALVQCKVNSNPSTEWSSSHEPISYGCIQILVALRYEYENLLGFCIGIPGIAVNSIMPGQQI